MAHKRLNPAQKEAQGRKNAVQFDIKCLCHFWVFGLKNSVEQGIKKFAVCFYPKGAINWQKMNLKEH